MSSAGALRECLPEPFLLINHVEIEDVHAALAPARDRIVSLATRPDPSTVRPLIAISEIDSFAKVSQVSAESVAAFANPLDLEEDVVERIITSILGEPYRQKDWGGELDDLFTTRVILEGRETPASFLLKGRGLRRKMRPKDLGHNGDQITRLTSQPAELFIVQHVNAIDAAVHRQLENAIIALRTSGSRHVVGSVWDGVTTARLGVAYGFLDPETGELRPESLS